MEESVIQFGDVHTYILRNVQPYLSKKCSNFHSPNPLGLFCFPGDGIVNVIAKWQLKVCLNICLGLNHAKTDSVSQILHIFFMQVTFVHTPKIVVAYRTTSKSLKLCSAIVFDWASNLYTWLYIYIHTHTHTHIN